MKSSWLFLLGTCVAGCMSSNGLQYEAVAETNVYRIARVRKGMSEKEVLQIMHKPYSYESFETDEDVYDVWFYVTKPTGLDQTRMVPQNLTPLTFKNGVLVGTGYSWYYFAMKEQANQREAEAPEATEEKPKSQALEDEEFEKALKPQTPAKTPAQQKTDSEKLPPNVRIVNDDTAISNNQLPLAVLEKTFSKIRKGMSKEEVLNRLGDPIDEKTLLVGDDTYEIFFYEVTPKDKKKAPQKVPLTFKNGTLVGLTKKEYNRVRQESGMSRIGEYDEQDERMQEDESEQNFNYW